MTPEGQIYGQNLKFQQFWGLYSHIPAFINVKFGTRERTFGPHPLAKFHIYRGNVSPMRGEKNHFWTTEEKQYWYGCATRRPAGNDIEWPLTPISRSRYFSTSNNSKMVQERAGRPTESRIWSVERRHFQWLWTILNLVFKVTPLFDTEYLTNGYRYGHSYYRTRIGNRTQAFE